MNNKMKTNYEGSRMIEINDANELKGLFEKHISEGKIKNIDVIEELPTLDLEDLLDDECDQIITSKELFKSFINTTKIKKYYSQENIKIFFKHIICLYNDTVQNGENYGSLTYLKKMANLLDYLDVSNICELSMKKLNILLDLEDNESIVSTYEGIVNNRQHLEDKHFKMFVDMLRNTKSHKIDKKEVKEIYNYVSSIYNSSTLLQDNVDYVKFLETLSQINLKSIETMRMDQFLNLFDVQDIKQEILDSDYNLSTVFGR